MSVDPYFEVYPDKKGEWRWTLYAANYKKVADSAEGYVKESECIAAIGRVKSFVPTAKIERKSAALGTILGTLIGNR